MAEAQQTEKDKEAKMARFWNSLRGELVMRMVLALFISAGIGLGYLVAFKQGCRVVTPEEISSDVAAAAETTKKKTEEAVQKSKEVITRQAVRPVQEAQEDETGKRNEDADSSVFK